jgi:ABC-2 type transport system permease protein
MDGGRVLAVARRHALVFWRTPGRYFDVSVWPLLDVLLWGALGTFAAQQGDAARAGAPVLLAGIIMFHVVFQVQITLATGFMEESTWSRNLLNVLVTPVTELEYVAGLLLFSLAKLGLALATLSIAAVVLYGFDLSSVGWALVPIAGALSLAGTALGLLVIALLLRLGQSAEILAWGLNYGIMAFSGVFNPVEALPGALQPLARLLPTTHAFSALRDVQAGAAVPWGDVGIAAAGGVVMVGLVGWFCVRMLRVFRQRGYVTRLS